LIEKLLGTDNLFVFFVIFSFFSIPTIYQPNVLTWGILGAIIFRFLFIFIGIKLLNAFAWITYVFGGILIISGIKLITKDKNASLDKKLTIRLLKKYLPISEDIMSGKFFKREGSIRVTLLFVALSLLKSLI
jgi:tellurite resistance protein TerC